jgi:glutamate-1-semialdehyde 2,1-aminomutase
LSLVERRIEEWRDKLYGEYERRTPGSKRLFEEARGYLPGGVTYHIRFFKPYPLFISRGEGARVWDVDGNVYTDYWMGHGALILGHRPRVLMGALEEAREYGTHLGFENPYAVEYAKLLRRVVPGLEMVRFTNSGTEANMYTVRLARAYTGRRYIVKFEGGWHGGYDCLHVGVTTPYEGPESLGLLEDCIKYTLVARFNDLSSVEELFRRHGGDIAAVIVEPVLGAGGGVEATREFLEGLRKLTREYGALLVFDEVITGFRLALGGAQEYYGVQSDIVVLGKIVGGGVPGAGAFGGRRDVMEMLDQLARPRARERSFHGGTFSGNPLTIIAGYKTVSFLEKNRGMYDRLNSLWSWASREIDRLCEERDRLCWVTGAGSIVGIHFTRKRPRSAREATGLRWSEAVYEALHAFMRVNGVVYVGEHMAHLLPSMAHSREDAERLVGLFDEFLGELHRLTAAQK